MSEKKTGRFAKLKCRVVGHKWKMMHTFPTDRSANELIRWIMDDHDYYCVCTRCGEKRGIDKSYAR